MEQQWTGKDSRTMVNPIQSSNIGDSRSEKDKRDKYKYNGIYFKYKFIFAILGYIHTPI